MIASRTLIGVVVLGSLPALVALAPASARQDSAAPSIRHAAVSHAVPLNPRHGKYRATITRTKHGIPHIVAHDWGSLGFGSGYATIQTDACSLGNILLTARGERSRYIGPDKSYSDHVSMAGTNLQADALVTDLHKRHVVEKLLKDPKAGPGPQARAMVRGYAAGVNKYLHNIGGITHLPDKTCVRYLGIHGANWIKPKVRPIDMWYGIYLANILASTGHFLPQIVGATPGSATDPGLPVLRTTASGAKVRTPQTIADARFSPVPKKLPSREALLRGLGQDPKTGFGSNATAVGRSITSTHKGMLMGNPHFPWIGRYRFTQQQLTIPGHYNVAGASLIGSPVVNIGWTKDVAWSHTVSTAYRFTPYEYRTVVSPTKYVGPHGITNVIHDVVKVKVRTKSGIKTVTQGMYRTPQGYVIDDPAELMGWTPLSFFAIRDANGEQLRTIDTFMNMAKAHTVRQLLKNQDAGGGMPWVNTIAADRAGTVLYADHSVVPNVSNALASKCMTPIGLVLHQEAGLPGLDGSRADGACKWGTDSDAERPGIFGPKNLPTEFRTDWVMNANDSYWLPNPKQPLTGYARIIGCEQCVRTLRTRMVDRYVLDRLKTGKKVTPKSLRNTKYANRVLGAEIMSKNGALVQLCRNAGGTKACNILAKWDKHSNLNSRGTVIFEEFVKRLPTAGLLGLLPAPNIWKVKFDPKDPVGTPRDLNPKASAAVKAMKAALAYLASKHINLDAKWGTLQVAGDRGAPPIPLTGGLGDQDGSTNALISIAPEANKSYYKAVDYGSSHIQVIAFEPHGKVLARTILTYGQSDNPSSKWSADQTRMFSKHKWVHFPFTAKQIKKQKISRRVITAKVG
ncbi:MAG TPA: penicillin acylase family protein [Marmoricola sp.]